MGRDREAEARGGRRTTDGRTEFPEPDGDWVEARAVLDRFGHSID